MHDGLKYFKPEMVASVDQSGRMLSLSLSFYVPYTVKKDEFCAHLTRHKLGGRQFCKMADIFVKAPGVTFLGPQGALRLLKAFAMHLCILSNPSYL